MYLWWQTGRTQCIYGERQGGPNVFMMTDREDPMYLWWETGRTQCIYDDRQGGPNESDDRQGGPNESDDRQGGPNVFMTDREDPMYLWQTGKTQCIYDRQRRPNVFMVIDSEEPMYLWWQTAKTQYIYDDWQGGHNVCMMTDREDLMYYGDRQRRPTVSMTYTSYIKMSFHTTLETPIILKKD